MQQPVMTAVKVVSSRWQSCTNTRRLARYLALVQVLCEPQAVMHSHKSNAK